LLLIHSQSATWQKGSCEEKKSSLLPIILIFLTFETSSVFGYFSLFWGVEVKLKLGAQKIAFYSKTEKLLEAFKNLKLYLSVIIKISYFFQTLKTF
jgi:hypothetical protein